MAAGIINHGIAVYIIIASAMNKNQQAGDLLNFGVPRWIPCLPVWPAAVHTLPARLACPIGFEPTISRVGVLCVIQLRYGQVLLNSQEFAARAKSKW